MWKARDPLHEATKSFLLVFYAWITQGPNRQFDGGVNRKPHSCRQRLAPGQVIGGSPVPTGLYPPGLIGGNWVTASIEGARTSLGRRGEKSRDRLELEGKGSVRAARLRMGSPPSQRRAQIFLAISLYFVRVSVSPWGLSILARAI